MDKESSKTSKESKTVSFKLTPTLRKQIEEIVDKRIWELQVRKNVTELKKNIVQEPTEAQKEN